MSLIAHYSFNDNTPKDSIGYSDGTEVGTVSYVDGKLGKAASFSSSHIDTDITDNLQDMSFSLWFKKINTWSHSIALMGERVASNGWMLYRNSGDTAGYFRIYFWYVNTSGGIVGYNAWPGISGMSLDTWYHIVLTRTADGYLKVWRDGTLVVNLSPPGDFSHWDDRSSSISIGSQAGGDTGYEATDTYIDDVKIFNHALSRKEALELSRAKVLHYTFDDFQEPTTNVVTYPNLDDGWSKGYCTNILWNDILPPQGVDSQVVSFEDLDGNGSGYWYSYGDYAPQEPSTTYTISVYARTIGDDWSIQAYTANNTEAGRQYTNGVTVPGDGSWHRVVFNPITTPSNTESDSLSFIFTTIPASQRCWLCAPQMEAKDHATPFVAGSRTGIVRDSSGQQADSYGISESVTPEWTSESKIGSGAYDFNGVATKYIRGELPGGRRIGDTFTICCWFYKRAHTVSSYPIFLSFGLPYIANDNASYFRFSYQRASDNAQVNISSTTVPALNTWYHVTVTSESGGNVKIFVNGVEEGSSTQSHLDDPNYVFDIGRLYGSDTYRMDGLIDDVRIYSTALSADDIKEIYQVRASIDNRGNLWAS